MNITEITNNAKKQTISRYILESLPDWFGIHEAREEYIEGSKDNIFFCAYEDYDKTNHFYLSLGFKEFEVFPTLWDEYNPCQVYVMAL